MRTALAFFILLLVLGSVYFREGSLFDLPTKTYRSPVESGKVVEIKHTAAQMASAAVAVTTKVSDKTYWQNLWAKIKEVIKAFFNSLATYLKTWPSRAKNNWLKFLGYPVDTGDRRVGYSSPGSLGMGTNSERTEYNFSSGTSTDDGNSTQGADLNLAVVPAANFTPAELANRLARTFSDPVQITINEENNAGIVVPQFKNGPGKTYIFLLTGSNNQIRTSTP